MEGSILDKSPLESPADGLCISRGAFTETIGNKQKENVSLYETRDLFQGVPECAADITDLEVRTRVEGHYIPLSRLPVSITSG